MRITNSMTIASTVRNLNNNAKRLSTAQEQMSSQSKIQLASDDPVVAARAIKYRNYVAKVEQYQSNVDDAISWQKVTDNALSDLNDVVQQIREYAVQGSTDSLADDDKQTIKTNVEQLKEQVMEIMNASYAGRYVFGGYVTDTEPYASETTAVGDKVTFKGQYMNLGGPMAANLSDSDIIDYVTANIDNMYESGSVQSIKYNIGYGHQIAINVEGQDVIGEGTESNLFDSIDKLLLGMDGATSYKTAAISTDPTAVTVETTTFSLDEVLADLDNDINRILTARSDLGARTNYLTMTKDRLDSDYNTYTKLMSNNEDVDVAEASTNVSVAEYVYEASLTVGAEVISKSLVDYIS